MADTGERDVRDRLAEALRVVSVGQSLADAPPGVRRVWEDNAADLLSALPTVGLRIGRVEE